MIEAAEMLNRLAADKLGEYRSLIARRDELIREALSSGVSERKAASRLKISPSQVHRIRGDPAARSQE